MLFDGMEYAWTRKVRMIRKSTTAAAMDLIHSSSSFLAFASAFSFTGAGRARAAARGWGGGTLLTRAGSAPPARGGARAGRRGRTNIRRAAGGHKPPGVRYIRPLEPKVSQRQRIGLTPSRGA